MKYQGRVVMDEDDQEFVQCNKCKMLQCLEGCKKHLTTRVMVAAGNTRMTLRAFG